MSARELSAALAGPMFLDGCPAIPSGTRTRCALSDMRAGWVATGASYRPSFEVVNV